MPNLSPATHNVPSLSTLLSIPMGPRLLRTPPSLPPPLYSM